MSIAVIIPVYNSSAMLRETLAAIQAGLRRPDELVVVDDGSTDDSADVAAAHGARIYRMDKNSGPAACRNHGAMQCQSDILVFLDADTKVHETTLQQFEDCLLNHPEYVGVMGAYDDTPSHPGHCSQFRNLAHCFIHRISKRDALTFWSGGGALRRSAFLEVEGFDEAYRRPSIEDIEMGYRITDAGGRILLDPSINVTHLKRWTVRNAISTDVFDRGIPWMILLLERGSFPNDLNLVLRYRISTGCALFMLVCLALVVESPWWLAIGFMSGLLSISLHVDLLAFLYERRGPKFLLGSVGLVLLQELCNLAAVAGGVWIWSTRSHRPKRLSRIGNQIVEQSSAGLTLPVTAS
jgi:glycosyltransferase involved in cell wall biosynthesis